MADSLIVARKIKKEPYWISYIKGRILKKKNFLAVITGATGSGKSWSGVSICSHFENYHIVTDIKQLMKLINSGTLSSGDAILWDEAGINLSNRDWQSASHKVINFLLQTFRHQRLILILTTPYQDFIDAQSRKLFHAEFLTQSIDYEKRVVKIKPLLIQYNSRFKKFYYKYLRVRTPKGIAVLKTWNVLAPTEAQIKHYEENKTKFILTLNKDIEQTLNEIENKEKPKIRIPLTDLQETAIKLKARFKKNSIVAEKMGLAVRTIRFHLLSAKKKGYLVEEFVENVKDVA